MHIKMFLPEKRIAVKGFAWAALGVTFTHPPRPKLADLDWQFAGDLSAATKLCKEWAEKRIGMPGVDVLTDVVLIQYADVFDIYIPLARAMCTPPMYLPVLEEALVKLGAAVGAAHSLKMYKE